ncbi:hypothetical protein [Roseixanthobacter liquoris]|jgi:hypothetical protein|uniref:hypothetical protein n=1 Tax=Roseixanthobacter liquoris TaxID=3119921 RepID=UPI000BD082A5|nr:MAG: hypothetical protein B7Y95_22280 [Rhizobiales bacterium 32-66-11]OYY83402.1 MAG: hypothetical protein B7Y61_10405 [Rhizobiales bacterium 35-66-30]OZA98613.1 MAG: hypothetical protein B7X67_21940 [Rhizobiales bacterium 39-66-18]HQS49727.1 hypothetical protein [Xanthobacteraceae bacterium]
MDALIRIFAERGDLAHLALLLWAASASAVAFRALAGLAKATERLDDFVRELARFNARHGGE